MITFEHDFRFLEAGVEQLESFLLSSSVYRPIGIQARRSETPYPQLTLGWLLLALTRARAAAQSDDQRYQLQKLETALQLYRSRWRTAWENKAAAEFRSRLKLWRDFLEEYRRDPPAHYDRYPYEVNRRVLLHLLGSECSPLSQAEAQTLSGLDKILRRCFQPGEFIWQANLAPSFPRADFWYLYGAIQEHIGDPSV
jgi:hypothetical protein